MDLYASLRDLGVIHIDVENLVTYDSRTRSDPGLMKLDAAKEVGQASREEMRRVRAMFGA